MNTEFDSVSPPIERLKDFWLRLPAGWRWCLGWWLLIRLALTIWGATIWSLDLIQADPLVDFDYFGLERIEEGIPGAVLGVWQRWDTNHYLRVVENGYFPGEVTAFFPLYPWLSRAVSSFTGGSGLVAMLLVSNIAFLLALVQLYRLVEGRFSPAVARQATLAALLFPGSLFFFAGYAESLAVLFILLAIRLARKQQWFLAAVCGFAAGLTLPTSLLLAPALAWIAWEQRQGASRLGLWARLAASGLPALAVALFMAWRISQGYAPYGQVQYQYWSWHIQNPIETFKWVPDFLTTELFIRVGWINLSAVLLAVAALIWGYKALSRESWIFLACVFVLLLVMRKEEEPLASWGRHMVVAYPMFIAIGDWFNKTHNSWARYLIIVLALSTYLYFAGNYFMWGWAG